jgi:hypothetical protein
MEVERNEKWPYKLVDKTIPRKSNNSIIRGGGMKIKEGGGKMDIEKEIEALKKRVKLLEDLRELQKKVEELEKQIAKPIPSPWRWDTTSGNTISGDTITSFNS